MQATLVPKALDAYGASLRQRSAMRALKSGFRNSGSLDEARRILAEIVEKYSKCQAKLAAWMEDSIPEGLTVFAFPAAVRQFLRTNNMEENLNRQIKQRTRLIPAFPNVSSLLRLVSAICAEISDDWETSSYRYMSTIKEL